MCSFNLFYPFFSQISWYPIGTDSVEAKVKSCASSETRPRQAALLLDTMPAYPGSQSHQCATMCHQSPPMCWRKNRTPGNRVSRATWCTVFPPATGVTSASSNPMMLCQLCGASWVYRSRPSARQPGIEPRSVVTQLVLRCCAVDHCATLEVFVEFYGSYLDFDN